jgi:hypothetical protein
LPHDRLTIGSRARLSSLLIAMKRRSLQRAHRSSIPPGTRRARSRPQSHRISSGCGSRWGTLARSFATLPPKRGQEGIQVTAMLQAKGLVKMILNTIFNKLIFIFVKKYFELCRI